MTTTDSIDCTTDELRALIQRAALSQRSAANRLGLSERYMRYMCEGKAAIPPVVILALREIISMQEAAAQPDPCELPGMPQVRRDMEDCKRAGLCYVCRQPAAPRTHSDAGRREYAISATCEDCFDAMFAEPEPEDCDGD